MGGQIREISGDPGLADNILPPTLEEAIEYFAEPGRSVAFVASRRWTGGVVRCPVCGGTDTRFLAARQLWECKSKHPGAQFSVRTGTLFADSHVSLHHWLVVIWMVANSERRVSSYQVARQVGVTQKTGWLMLRRIKCAARLRNYYLAALRASRVAPARIF
jgi:hypothetical protein